VIADIIVIGALAFAAAFTLAWLMRPDLRAWIEQPKHRFQANVRQYDRRDAVASIRAGEDDRD
jgi:hypothetical protein